MTESYFREIFDQYNFSLVRFATSIVGDFYAQDFVQDAFLNLFKSDTENHKNIKAFLVICVKNNCNNHLRKERRKYKVNNDLKYLDDISDDYIEAQVTKGFYVQKLVEEINQLPKERKKVIKLYHGGFSPQEISIHLKIAESTVWGQTKRFIDGFIKKLKSVPELKEEKLPEYSKVSEVANVITMNEKSKIDFDKIKVAADNTIEYQPGERKVCKRDHIQTQYTSAINPETNVSECLICRYIVQQQYNERQKNKKPDDSKKRKYEEGGRIFCKKGHPLDIPNAIRNGNCRVCRNETLRIANAKQREKKAQQKTTSQTPS